MLDCSSIILGLFIKSVLLKIFCIQRKTIKMTLNHEPSSHKGCTSSIVIVLQVLFYILAKHAKCWLKVYSNNEVFAVVKKSIFWCSHFLEGPKFVFSIIFVWDSAKM